MLSFPYIQFSSVQSPSHVQLCDPMDCSRPGLLVHHQLLEFTQTHVLSRWCHPTISSSVFPFSSCLQSFPASGSFLMSQLFSSGGQGIVVSASVSVFPMNIQVWFPLGWTGWIFILRYINWCSHYEKTVWRFLKRLKLELLYYPAIPLLGIYLEIRKTLISKDICIKMFIAALFIVAKIWKQPKSIKRWTAKDVFYIYTMEISHKKNIFCHFQQCRWA